MVLAYNCQNIDFTKVPLLIGKNIKIIPQIPTVNHCISLNNYIEHIKSDAYTILEQSN